VALGWGNTFTVLRRRAFLRKWSLERLRGDGMKHMMMVRMESDCVGESGIVSCAALGCGIYRVKSSGFCYQH
jgi:hypothetical protein